MKYDIILNTRKKNFREMMDEFSKKLKEELLNALLEEGIFSGVAFEKGNWFYRNLKDYSCFIGVKTRTRPHRNSHHSSGN